MSRELCSARCWNAKGPDCVCACGGAFHGQGRGFVIRSLESEPSRSDIVRPTALQESLFDDKGRTAQDHTVTTTVADEPSHKEPDDG